MTVTASDLPSAMPVAPATVVGAPNARPYTRVRARVAATLRDLKVGVLAARIASTATADVRGWWLLAAAPTSLGAWLAGQSPATRRVPAGNGLLRAAWVAHNWTLGLIATALSVALFLAAGALRWLACHPVRPWAALIVTAATVTALLHL